MPGRSRLDTLLRIRRLEEDLAKAELAVANRTERQAQEHLQGRLERYRAAGHGYDAVDPTAFLRARAAGAALGASIVQAEQRYEAAAAAVEESRAMVRVARMRTQGLERLVERAADTSLEERLAADQRAAEESVARKQTGGRG